MKNIIRIKNTTFEQLEKSLILLQELYSKSGFLNSVLINRASLHEYIVEFPDSPDFEHFCYFVNYLKYPFENYTPQVCGIWTLDEIIKGLEILKGEIVLVYVSIDDQEHDNVNIADSAGNIFMFSFSGKTTREGKKELNYEKLINLPSTEPYFELKDQPETHQEKPWWKFWWTKS